MIKTSFSSIFSKSFDEGELHLYDKSGVKVISAMKAKFVHFFNKNTSQSVESMAFQSGNRLIAFDSDVNFIYLTSKPATFEQLKELEEKGSLVIIDFPNSNEKFFLSGPVLFEKERDFLKIVFYNRAENVMTTISVTEMVWNNTTVIDCVELNPSEVTEIEF